MIKTDVKKDLRQLYTGKVGEPVVVQVPRMKFIMIDGVGDPASGSEYPAAIQALYPVAYTLKFTSKFALGEDFVVMPLESLWWSPGPDFREEARENWLWTAMIMQPDIVTDELFGQALDKVRAKQPSDALERVRFESYDEGRAAQVMYRGPYSAEGPTIQHLHDFIRAQGGTLDGTNKHHHEIYLGDPRRSDPEKLKTIIRQPF